MQRHSAVAQGELMGRFTIEFVPPYLSHALAHTELGSRKHLFGDEEVLRRVVGTDDEGEIVYPPIGPAGGGCQLVVNNIGHTHRPRHAIGVGVVHLVQPRLEVGIEIIHIRKSYPRLVVVALLGVETLFIEHVVVKHIIPLGGVDALQPVGTGLLAESHTGGVAVGQPAAVHLNREILNTRMHPRGVELPIVVV